MSRPLLISDCDEVLLHMVVPFRQWLDEAHAVHFDFSARFEDALRHKDSGDPVERMVIWRLLSGFFVTEMHRQSPIAGAVEALARIGERADIVILTNIDASAGAGRAAQLRAIGLDHPVICNRGGKGPAVRDIVERYRPSVTLFVDDLEHNHESVAAIAPDVWRLHMVGEPEMAVHVADSPHAHARIDRWAEALPWLLARIDEGAPAPAPLDRAVQP
jgi:FMN phosphatase YigB (HAD superfamily)